MQRINAQPTFTDLAVADLGGPRATAFFERCSAEVPFEELAAWVADVFVESARGCVNAGTAARCSTRRWTSSARAGWC